MGVNAHARHPRAQSVAYSLIHAYGNEALPVALRQIDARLREGDAEGALEMDQVRREVVALLSN